MSNGSSKRILQSFQDELEQAVLSFAEQLAEEQSKSSQLLESKKVYKERLQQEFKGLFDSFGKTMQIGIRQLFHTLTEIATHKPDLITKEVKQDIRKLAILLKSTEEALKEMGKSLERGTSCQEILGLSDQTIEAFYQAAKQLYEQQRYPEASATFQLLTVINDKVPLFWLALGNSEYFCKRYESALMAYAIAGYIDPFDPTCQLYSCKCYEELGQIDTAKNALDLALIAIGDDKTEALLIQKIGEEHQRLSRKKSSIQG